MKKIFFIILLAVLFIGCKKQSGTLAIVENTGSAMFSPDDSRIQYTGRIDFSNPKRPAFTFPGVSIRAGFEGTSISVLMKNIHYGSHINYYNIIIDDTLLSVLKASPFDTLYKVAFGLQEGIHKIEVFKRTESLVGKCEFLGFQLEKGKSLLSSPAKFSRKMEFIGNSITCGYGNEARDQYQPFEAYTENNYLAFGAITARNLDAEYVAVCYSGKGVYRNYGGSTVDPLPSIYNRIFPDEPTSLWNSSKYTPDVVVVDLGTNDFSQSGTDSTLFVSAYQKFVTTIRENYPKATIFCVVGPMMSDYHPLGERGWTRIQNYLSSMVTEFKKKGDAQVYFLALSQQGEFGFGADFHPNIAQHAYNADELTKFIKLKTGWKSGEEQSRK